MGFLHVLSVLGLSTMFVFTCCGAKASAEVVILDDFETVDQWRVISSERVTASISQVEGTCGKAMKVDFDFGGGGLTE